MDTKYKEKITPLWSIILFRKFKVNFLGRKRQKGKMTEVSKELA